jgi:predicted DNA binding CopG/RHH family protein
LPKGTQNARISNHIRISEKDLLALQKHAVREGLPYQTLVSSVLHKYVTGALVER